MTRIEAVQFTREQLAKHGLKDWSVKLTTNENSGFLGLCDYRSKSIILNAHYIDIYQSEETRNTILHEVAHAILGPGFGHGEQWQNKAREIGCDNTLPCSHLDLPSHVLDAIRSGQMVELEIEEKVITNVIRTPKFKVTRLVDKCPECGKDAIEMFAVDTVNKQGDKVKMITLKCFHVITKVTPKGTPFETMVSNFWKPEIAACEHDWNKHQCLKCGEFRLMNFQIEGARFAEYGLSVQKGVGIFDDMGLGKTVQGLSIPRFHKKYLPFLVVTKSAITYQWFKQIVRWLGPDHLAQIIKTSKDPLIPGLKAYIVSYDLLRRLDRKQWDKIGLKLVLLDEVQQIKNVDSSRTREVRELVRNQDIKVIELSATPWKNRGSELFPALNLIDPIKFHSYQDFIQRWVDYYFHGEYKKQGGIANIVKFKEYTKDLIIRREFNEVIAEFPDINKMKLPVQLDELQQSTYNDEIGDFVKWYNDLVISGEEDSINGIEILAKLARARHITGLAKIPATLAFTEEFVEDTNRKLTIFVHHKDVGELMYHSLKDVNPKTNPDWHELANECFKQGIKILKYTSELNDVERYQMQELFNSSTRAILIASTLACGEGVDLQTCSDCILHERQWNPQNEEQAAPGRFRRIGQTAKSINITIPEAEETVDWDLDNIIETKRKFYHDAMNKSEFKGWSEGDIGRELGKAIAERWNKKNKGKVVAGIKTAAMR